jgi:membrane protein implicated in regulation of membrane protease activity
MSSVRRLVAVLLLLLAAASAGITLLWAYGKAFGAEFDLCPDGGQCYSGWFGVAAFTALTVALVVAARRVVHATRERPRTR